jgi:uncharacterized protein YjbI with pentapeptide repeats
VKAEIQKIMAMNKSGALTDEQAANLLAALAETGSSKSGSDAGDEKEAGSEWNGRGGFHQWHGFHSHGHWGMGEFDAHHLRRRIRHAVRHGHWDNILEGVVDGIFGGLDHVPEGENTISRSRVESPEGRDFVFKANAIDCSHVSGLEFQDAEVTGNRIRSTRLSSLRISPGKLVQSMLLASSLDKLSLAESEISELRLRASKWRNISLADRSALRSLECNASAIEDLALRQHSSWTASSLHGVHISGLDLRDSSLNDVRMTAGFLKDVVFDEVRADKLVLRGMGFKDVTLKQSEFNDVLFAPPAGWKWKWARFDSVRIEQSRLSGVSFTECRLSKCNIRNVTVSDLALKGIDLSGQSIDGTEAFLKAVGKA